MLHQTVRLLLLFVLSAAGLTAAATPNRTLIAANLERKVALVRNVSDDGRLWFEGCVVASSEDLERLNEDSARCFKFFGDVSYDAKDDRALLTVDQTFLEIYQASVQELRRESKQKAQLLGAFGLFSTIPAVIMGRSLEATNRMALLITGTQVATTALILNLARLTYNEGRYALAPPPLTSSTSAEAIAVDPNQMLAIMVALEKTLESTKALASEPQSQPTQ